MLNITSLSLTFLSPLPLPRVRVCVCWCFHTTHTRELLFSPLSSRYPCTTVCVCARGDFAPLFIRTLSDRPLPTSQLLSYHKSKYRVVFSVYFSPTFLHKCFIILLCHIWYRREWYTATTPFLCLCERRLWLVYHKLI